LGTRISWKLGIVTSIQHVLEEKAYSIQVLICELMRDLPSFSIIRLQIFGYAYSRLQLVSKCNGYL